MSKLAIIFGGNFAVFESIAGSILVLVIGVTWVLIEEHFRRPIPKDCQLADYGNCLNRIRYINLKKISKKITPHNTYTDNNPILAIIIDVLIFFTVTWSVIQSITIVAHLEVPSWSVPILIILALSIAYAFAYQRVINEKRNNYRFKKIITTILNQYETNILTRDIEILRKNNQFNSILPENITDDFKQQLMIALSITYDFNHELAIYQSQKHPNTNNQKLLNQIINQIKYYTNPEYITKIELLDNKQLLHQVLKNLYQISNQEDINKIEELIHEIALIKKPPLSQQTFTPQDPTIKGDLTGYNSDSAEPKLMLDTLNYEPHEINLVKYLALATTTGIMSFCTYKLVINNLNPINILYTAIISLTILFCISQIILKTKTKYSWQFLAYFTGIGIYAFIQWGLPFHHFLGPIYPTGIIFSFIISTALAQLRTKTINQVVEQFRPFVFAAVGWTSAETIFNITLLFLGVTPQQQMLLPTLIAIKYMFMFLLAFLNAFNDTTNLTLRERFNTHSHKIIPANQTYKPANPDNNRRDFNTTLPSPVKLI